LAKVDIQLDLGENEYDPQDFVNAAVCADELGFRTVWLGDHIFPWFHSGNRSAFVWSVLGVVLEKTRRIRVGPGVTVPIGARYPRLWRRQLPLSTICILVGYFLEWVRVRP
jgi:alkanesulfonate monooxygenase SsuD/methylene tetrahydromethanopterin reductase-like flavin-dependent oxidoreductase (luciferase family)